MLNTCYSNPKSKQHYTLIKKRSIRDSLDVVGVLQRSLKTFKKKPLNNPLENKEPLKGQRQSENKSIIVSYAHTKLSHVPQTRERIFFVCLCSPRGSIAKPYSA